MEDKVRNLSVKAGFQVVRWVKISPGLEEADSFTRLEGEEAEMGVGEGT